MKRRSDRRSGDLQILIVGHHIDLLHHSLSWSITQNVPCNYEGCIELRNTPRILPVPCQRELGSSFRGEDSIQSEWRIPVVPNPDTCSFFQEH
eukprot:Skav226493  [mRNA]  locus=scaffold4305:2532:4490:- [translate_table: standard]